ncbi:TetR/AcrR family transcriptional regulator [Sphingobacterium sp. HMA12]|uniref:TetR/AcrR family transcriptional regulator n=1 Tax=Sphingobacterium sp. HMA12 TaxID=2050894 RepID=UPI000CEA3744|nr:TetR/AcrR family transcriptional regulator [Sphingobacterium sp. HMA12]
MTKGEETKQFIIERAAPIFNTKGIAATSMSDIMEATQLSKGSMYVHFENKDVLACAAVDYNMDLLQDKLGKVLEKSKSYKEKLLTYIDFFSDPNRPPVAGGCPILNFGTEVDDTNPIIRQKVLLVIKQAQQLLSEIIKKAIADEELKAELNPADFAIAVFAMLEGGHLMSRVSGHNDSMKAIVKTLKNLIEEYST